MRGCRYERDVEGKEVLKGIINGILYGYLSICPFLGRVSIPYFTFSKESNDLKMLSIHMSHIKCSDLKELLLGATDCSQKHCNTIRKNFSIS